MFLCVNPGCAAVKVVIQQNGSILCSVANEFFVLCYLVNDRLCLDNVSTEFGENLDKQVDTVYLYPSTQQFGQN